IYKRNSQRPAKSPTDSSPQPSFGPCCSTKAIVCRSRDEPNRGESATLPSPPIFMLVADMGRSGRLVFEFGVDVWNLGDRLFEKAPVDRILARLLFDVAHRHDGIDAVQDEVRLSSLIDFRRLSLPADSSVL